MEGLLDVHCGDVVGEQDNLVGVKLVAELVFTVLRTDEARAEQSRDEGPGPGEGVQDVDTFIAERCTERGVEHPLHSVDHVVHDLNGRVDNAELVGGDTECSSEELVVELFDDLLLACGSLDALDSLAD